MRFALNAGKSSGVRVLYVDLVLLEEVYLISAYAKSNKSNLTSNEKSEVKKLIDLLKKPLLKGGLKMNYDSIINGLNEAVKISNGEIKGRKQSMSIATVSDFSHDEIKGLRSSLHLIQLAFAQLIGVSSITVEAWEKGTNSPSGPARRLISMIKEDPQLTEKYHLTAR